VGRLCGAASGTHHRVRAVLRTLVPQAFVADGFLFHPCRRIPLFRLNRLLRLAHISRYSEVLGEVLSCESVIFPLSSDPAAVAANRVWRSIDGATRPGARFHGARAAPAGFWHARAPDWRCQGGLFVHWTGCAWLFVGRMQSRVERTNWLGACVPRFGHLPSCVPRQGGVSRRRRQ
jgi:hypothetical protein